MNRDKTELAVLIVIANLRPWHQFQFLMRWLASHPEVIRSYNTRHKSWNTYVRFPFPKLIWVLQSSQCSKIDVIQGKRFLFQRFVTSIVETLVFCVIHSCRWNILLQSAVCKAGLLATFCHLRNISRIKKYINRHTVACFHYFQIGLLYFTSVWTTETNYQDTSACSKCSGQGPVAWSMVSV